MRRIERPAAWLSDQAMPELIGNSDDVLSWSTEDARTLLERLFGPSFPRTILVQTITSRVNPGSISLQTTVVKAADVTVRMEAAL